MKRVDWCEEAGVNLYKIASRSVDDKNLCNKIINTKKTIISLGMYDFKNKKLPYEGENLIIYIVYLNIQQCYQKLKYKF